MVDIFSSSDWRTAVEQWGRRDANVPLRNIVGRDLGVDVRTLDALLEAADRVPDRPTVDAVLADAFSTASAVAGGPVVLALHVYSECLRSWEACADYRRIGAVVGRLSEAPNDLVLPDGDDVLLQWIATYASRSLMAAMAVERAELLLPVRDGTAGA